jgi:cytidylate kinase
MFNVLTIAREYGSGGSEIGRKVAELLGWQCVDKQIIERVAAMGSVEQAWAEHIDERAITWWQRVMKSLRQGGPESYISGGIELGVDHDMAQQFTARVIQEAANEGNCVIIGRSSGFVLRHSPNVLRLLVYAPMAEKLKRMQVRHPKEKDLPTLVRRMDAERTYYAQNYYGFDPTQTHLYHLCLNSTMGIETCAKVAAQIIQSSRTAG